MLKASLALTISLASFTRAFYAFEPIEISQSEIQSTSTCSIVTAEGLIAYSCTGVFKVYDVRNIEKPLLLYSTANAVEQIQASRLISDPFISFIEAKLPDQKTPAAFAYLKVVDRVGLRDLGLSSSLLANRSMYLGGSIGVRIPEEETYLQVFDIQTSLNSNQDIKVVGLKVSYDFYSIDKDTQQWIAVACSQQQPKCYFYKIQGNKVTTISNNNIVGMSCISKVALTKRYVMLQCASTRTLALYTVDSTYIMGTQFYKLESMEVDDATITQLDDKLSTVHFTKSYIWPEGQSNSLAFIDTLRIIRDDSVATPLVIRFERDIFYEIHAKETDAQSYDKHILVLHRTPALNPSISSFSITGMVSTIVVKDNQGVYRLFQMTQCGLNSVRKKNPLSPAQFYCYQPKQKTYINWAKMADHGLIQSSDCDTTPTGDQINVQNVLRAYNCLLVQKLNLSGLPTSYTIPIKHLELVGVKCSVGQFLIEGHCVDCGILCTKCTFPNTDDQVYGFYLGTSQQTGTCAECGLFSNLELSKCTCLDTFFYSETTRQCEPCGKNCKKCSSAESCSVCKDSFVLDSIGQCVSTICDSSFFFNFADKRCQNCYKSCATCKSAEKCDTCPESFKLGANICLQCRTNQVIVGDACRDCGIGCSSCSSVDRCDYCVANASIGLTGQCQCQNGLFMDPVIQACLNCGETCKTCLGADKCTTCQDGFSLGETKCLQCQSNQFISGDLCLNCGVNCLKCSSLTSCDVCDNNSVFKNGACQCIDGFFMDKISKTCVACGKTCLTCDDANSCKTCPPGQGLGATRCLSCESNQFIKGDQCQNCGFNCLKCDAGPNQCKSCISDSSLKLGQCICNDGTFLDQISNKCKECGKTCATCNNLLGCKTCKVGFSLGETICLQCGSDQYIQGDTCQNCGINCLKCDAGPDQCKICAQNSELQADGTCRCQNGFFFDEQTVSCKSCHNSCETCSNAAFCSTCKPEFPLIGTAVCYQCKSDEFLSSEDKCVNCGTNCSRCIKGPDQCLDCANNLVLKDGKCSCNNGFFLNQATSSCQQCSKTCATCDNALACKMCPNGYKLGFSICLKCGPDEYIEGDSCVKCGMSCLTCDTGPNKCKSCSENSELKEDGTCVCSKGFFLDAQTSSCKSCETNCNKCTKGPDQCLECANDLALKDGKCSCNDGFFLNQNFCKQCDSDCLTCSQSGSCLTCPNGKSKGATRCLSCDQNQFAKLDACAPCSAEIQNCAQCTKKGEQVICTQCRSSFSFFNNICACDTGLFFEEKENLCKTCATNCVKCSSETTCLVCKIPGDIIVDGICVPIECKDGFFRDSLTGLCMPCSSNCATCIDRAEKCLSCASPAAQFITDAATCFKCELGVDTLSPQTCKCQEGYFFSQDLKKCQPCADSQCKKCDSTGNQCLICKQNFQIDAATAKCTCPLELGFFTENNFCKKCSFGCLSCLDDSTCLVCSPGTVFGKTYCVACETPQNFVSGDSCYACPKFCAECHARTGRCLKCKPSFTMKQSESRKCACPAGTYFETESEECLPCTDNCEICLDQNQCVLCRKGYEFDFKDLTCAIMKSPAFDKIEPVVATVTTNTESSQVLVQGIGISVGATVGFFALLAVTIYCFKKYRRGKDQKSSQKIIPQTLSEVKAHEKEDEEEKSMGQETPHAKKRRPELKVDQIQHFQNNQYVGRNSAMSPKEIHTLNKENGPINFNLTIESPSRTMQRLADHEPSGQDSQQQIDSTIM